MNVFELLALVAVGVFAGVALTARPRPVPVPVPAAVNRVAWYYRRSAN